MPSSEAEYVGLSVLRGPDPTRPGARRLFARVLVGSLIPALIRGTVQRNRVTILVYHRPSVTTMREHLEFLSSRYVIVPLRQFVDALRGAGLRGLPRRALVVTFDDGYRSNRDLLDVFSSLGIPATIFVCTGIVGTCRTFWFRQVENPGELTAIPDDERLQRLQALAAASETDPDAPEALSRADMAAMVKGGFDLQSHTVSHPILPRCGPEKARREIFQSKRQLEADYGLDVYALAYPNGEYSDRDITLARSAGYACGLTVDLGFNSSTTDVFRLRRIAIDDHDDQHELAVKACGLWGLLKRLVRAAPAGYVSGISA